MTNSMVDKSLHWLQYLDLPKYYPKSDEKPLS